MPGPKSLQRSHGELSVTAIWTEVTNNAAYVEVRNGRNASTLLPKSLIHTGRESNSAPKAHFPQAWGHSICSFFFLHGKAGGPDCKDLQRCGIKPSAAKKIAVKLRRKKSVCLVEALIYYLHLLQAILSEDGTSNGYSITIASDRAFWLSYLSDNLD